MMRILILKKLTNKSLVMNLILEIFTLSMAEDHKKSLP